MKTLDEAWGWYCAVRDNTKWLTHLAKFWGELPWGQNNEWLSQLERNNVLRHLEPDQMENTSQRVEGELQDLAVLLLFSVFEANIRELVESQVLPEIAQLQHRALKNAADELLSSIRDGSFGFLLQRLKDPLSKDLIAQVDQIRKYRNWVAHGRRDDMKPENLVQPPETYERLKAFLALIQRAVPIANSEPI